MVKVVVDLAEGSIVSVWITTVTGLPADCLAGGIVAAFTRRVGEHAQGVRDGLTALRREPGASRVAIIHAAWLIAQQPTAFTPAVTIQLITDATCARVGPGDRPDHRPLLDRDPRAALAGRCPG